MFAFAREHNLYLVKVATKDTVQLTRDGVKNYSFGARDTLQERQQQELDNSSNSSSRTIRRGEQGGGGGRRRRSIAIRACARTSRGRRTRRRSPSRAWTSARSASCSS